MIQMQNTSPYGQGAYPSGYPVAMMPQAQVAQASQAPVNTYAPPMASTSSPSSYAGFSSDPQQAMLAFMKKFFTRFMQSYTAPQTHKTGYDQYWKAFQGRGTVEGFDKPAPGHAPGQEKPGAEDSGMEHPTAPRAPRPPHAPNIPGHPPTSEAPKAPGTPAPSTPKAPDAPTAPTAPGETPPAKPGENVPAHMRDIETNYRSLTTDQREQLSGLSAEELGLLHAGGRGLSFTGSREGIYMSYFTGLDSIRDGLKISDRDKAAILQAKAMDEKEGLPPGTSFERNYLSTLDKLTGTKEFTKVLEGAPPVIDNGKRLQVPDNLNPASQEFVDFQKQQGNTNANYGNMMVITQWNHDLLDDGLINGSINAHELASQQKGTSLVEGKDATEFLQALLDNEMVDGEFNNTNGQFFMQAFNSAYNKNVKPVELADIQAATKSQSTEAGLTLAKVREVAKQTVDSFLQGGKEGFSKGIQDHAKAMVEKPGAVAANAGNMALAAVCPYVAGLGSVVGNANSASKA